MDRARVGAAVARLAVVFGDLGWRPPRRRRKWLALELPPPPRSVLDDLADDEPPEPDDPGFDPEPEVASMARHTLAQIRRSDADGRHRTTAEKRILKDDLRVGAFLYPEPVERPRTRAECPPVRPCPHAGCRYHLGYEVKASGSIVELHPGVEIWDLSHSCALDEAAQGGLTLEEVGERLNITRERTRQIEVVAIAKLGEAARRLGLEFEEPPCADERGDPWSRA